MRSKLDAGDEVLLCRADDKWYKTATKIRMGVVPLWQGLQGFLMFLGTLLEKVEESVEVDAILASACRDVTLPERRDLTELESASLAVLEEKWLNMVREARAGTLSPPEGCKEFMRLVGKYLSGFSTQKKSPLVEQHRTLVELFYHSRKIGGVRVPPLPSTDEQLRAWFVEGKNLIFEPSEKDAPGKTLLSKLPHRLLDDPEQIVLEPVEEGRWLLVDAAERCPRVGERSYKGLTLSLEPGQRILTLPQYAILWHFGGADGALLDLETDTMLATRYGADSVVHAFGNLALSALEFSVGEWRHLMRAYPKMGVRTARIIS